MERFGTEETIRIVLSRSVSLDELCQIEGFSMEAHGRNVIIDVPRDTDFKLVLRCFPPGVDILEYSRQPVSLRQAVKWAAQE